MSSRGVNKVILVGRLGDDPEIRYMGNGNPVANVSLATSESWKDQGGHIQERTEWHRVAVYGPLAKIIGDHLKKGAQAYFEGKLQTRKWQNQQGQDRYTTEVICDKMEMLGSNTQDNPHNSHNRQQSTNYNPDGSPKSPSQMKNRR